MSKQYGIRWRRSDTAKLSHLIRKANKKTFGLEVKRPDLAGHIPEQLDYQTVKQSIKTRQDYNRFMNKWQRYLREGSEELVKSDRGAVATKWEVNEFNIMQRAENVRRAHLRKTLGEEEATIGGKSTGVKRAEMGRTRDNSLRSSKKKFKNMSKKEWENAFKFFDQQMNETSREEGIKRHIRNYIKGLIAEGYSDVLIEMLQHIPLEDFRHVFGVDEIATYDFIYDPIELKAKQDSLIELWSPYVDKDTYHDIDVSIINKEVEREYLEGSRIRGRGRAK